MRRNTKTQNKKKTAKKRQLVDIKKKLKQVTHPSCCSKLVQNFDSFS